MRCCTAAALLALTLRLGRFLPGCRNVSALAPDQQSPIHYAGVGNCVLPHSVCSQPQRGSKLLCAVTPSAGMLMQAIVRIAAEERAKLFVPVSIAQYSVYEALAADLLSR